MISQPQISRRPGKSNIVSSITSSIIARRPRAPHLRSIAMCAIARTASSSNVSSTPSRPSSFWYCLHNAFFGSVRIRTSASSSSASSVTVIGRRPTNSGIRPNFVKSSGRSFFSASVLPSGVLLVSSAPKPRFFLPVRLSIIGTMPSNAPPQMKRMFVVSIWIISCCGCFRPPCGGTEASVPSRIFSSACCTPSPLTSRVIDGFSLLRAILSISSM